VRGPSAQVIIARGQAGPGGGWPRGLGPGTAGERAANRRPGADLAAGHGLPPAGPGL